MSVYYGDGSCFEKQINLKDRLDKDNKFMPVLKLMNMD